MVRASGDERPVPHQDHRPTAGRPRPLQRHRPRGVVQRDEWCRGRSRLDVPRPPDRLRRVCVRGRIGPGVRRRRRRGTHRHPGSGVAKRPRRHRAGARRDAAPPRGPVRLRHVLPDRPGTSGPEGHLRARPAASPTDRRDGRVPVRLLPHHLCRRRATCGGRLRRVLRAQPGWQRGFADRDPRGRRRRPGRPADPQRHLGAGPRLRDRDRPRPHARLRPGPATGRRPHPYLGGRRHVARRRVCGRQIRGAVGLRGRGQRGTAALLGASGACRCTRWITDGTPPPSAPPLHLSSPLPPKIADDLGNALGGVRTPLVYVPVAAVSGDAAPGASRICALFGSTVPFDDATLVGLYGDRSGYLAAFERSLDEAIGSGFLLGSDRGELLAQAWGGPFSPELGWRPARLSPSRIGRQRCRAGSRPRDSHWGRPRTPRLPIRRDLGRTH